MELGLPRITGNFDYNTSHVKWHKTVVYKYEVYTSKVSSEHLHGQIKVWFVLTIYCNVPVWQIQATIRRALCKSTS